MEVLRKKRAAEARWPVSNWLHSISNKSGELWAAVHEWSHIISNKSAAKARPALGRWLRSHLNGYTVYRLLSHYGTSYWHAALMLIVMVACFSWIFLFTGFQPNPEETREAVRLIEYDWGGSTGLSHVLSDYKKSFLLTLSIMTFQRQRFYVPMGEASQLWVLIATLVLTAQVALVLLAIRRRFKR
jgi:hypothetical protein